jgi:hypothetical protein
MRNLMIRYLFAAALLISNMAIAAVPPPTGQRWLAVASTKDLEVAKNIAGYYSQIGARVMEAQDGWYAVVLGPFKASKVSDIRDDRLTDNLPPDALLTEGAKYKSEIWRTETDATIADPLSEYAPGKPGRFSAGELAAEVTLQGDEDNPAPTEIKGTLTGQPAFSFSTSNDFSIDFARAGFLPLDPYSEHPTLVVTRYTGGAHCCTQTWFVTKPKGASSWTMIDGQMLDGEGYRFEDVDGDGTPEIVNTENSLLYAFGSYAESYSFQRHWQLRNGKLTDVTFTPQYRSAMKQQLDVMDFEARIRPDNMNSNGFLAPWVALKIALGEGEAAWTRMLASYQKQSDFGPQVCLTGKPIEECAAEEMMSVPFPRALAQFLRDNNLGPLPATAENELK